MLFEGFHPGQKFFCEKKESRKRKSLSKVKRLVKLSSFVSLKLDFFMLRFLINVLEKHSPHYKL